MEQTTQTANQTPQVPPLKINLLEIKQKFHKQWNGFLTYAHSVYGANFEKQYHEDIVKQLFFAFVNGMYTATSVRQTAKVLMGKECGKEITKAFEKELDNLLDYLEVKTGWSIIKDHTPGTSINDLLTKLRAQRPSFGEGKLSIVDLLKKL